MTLPPAADHGGDAAGEPVGSPPRDRAPLRAIDGGRTGAAPAGPAPDIGALYERYAPMLIRRILQFFGEHEAEEVLHDVFVQTMQSWSQYRGECSPARWLYRLVTNHCLNRARLGNRRRELLREQEGSLWYDDALQPAQESALILAELWRELPDELLTIAVYHHVDGLTHAEIADLTGLSRRSIGNRLDELRERARRVASRTGTGGRKA
jgi:RNA polymerase sigma-70 factor (ECF subfamily)